MITNTELKGFLGERLAAYDEVVLDGEYALPTREWVLGDFSVSLLENLRLIGAHVYRPERNDCDDFALFAAGMARLCHNLTTPFDRALAFGVLTYQQDSGGGHAINFAVVHDGTGQRELMFYEPQTRREVFLSQSERDNAITYIV